TTLVFEGESLWVGHLGEYIVLKLDTNGRVLGTFPFFAPPGAIGFDGQLIWVSPWYDAQVLSPGMVIITKTGELVARLPVGFNAGILAFDGRSMWASNPSGDTVSRFTPLTN
ncbi:MAG: YncE family protein, partial [Dehalococcoidia bacterium]